MKQVKSLYCDQLKAFLTTSLKQRNRSSSSKETNDLPINVNNLTRFSLFKANKKHVFLYMRNQYKNSLQKLETKHQWNFVCLLFHLLVVLCGYFFKNIFPITAMSADFIISF